MTIASETIGEMVAQIRAKTPHHPTCDGAPCSCLQRARVREETAAFLAAYAAGRELVAAHRGRTPEDQTP